MSGLQAKIEAWFRDHYQKESFRLSMGEIHVQTAGMLVAFGFIAQGVALLAMRDKRYLDVMMDTHKRMVVLNENVQKLLPDTYLEDQSWHFSMHTGCILEIAIKAVQAVSK